MSVAEEHNIQHKVEPIPSFPTGGRSLVHFDAKSAEYPAKGVLFAADAPLGSQWWWRPGPFDQGNSSSCTSQSASGAIVTVPTRFARKAAVRDVVLKEDYRLGFYTDIQRHDEWEGEEPTYQGSSVLAAAKTAKLRGLIDEYRWGFGLQEVLQILSNHGAVVLGTNWYSSMFDPVGSRARLDITDVATNEGGHAYEIHGINVRRKVVAGTNSWGTGWGNKGRFEMAWETLDRLLHEDGEAVTYVVQDAG